MVDEEKIINTIQAELRGENGEIKTVHVPVFSFDYVPPHYCAKWARLATDHLFGKKFSMVPAWDRIYADNLIEEISARPLSYLVKKGILQPGMILGVVNPNSPILGRKDFSGGVANYTHNIIYLGLSLEDEPLFAEQFNDLTQVFSEKEMYQRHLTPIDIFDSKT